MDCQFFLQPSQLLHFVSRNNCTIGHKFQVHTQEFIYKNPQFLYERRQATPSLLPHSICTHVSSLIKLPIRTTIPNDLSVLVSGVYTPPPSFTSPSDLKSYGSLHSSNRIRLGVLEQCQWNPDVPISVRMHLLLGGLLYQLASIWPFSRIFW